MPITQDRMLALIHAAETNLSAHRLLLVQLRNAANDSSANLGEVIAKALLDPLCTPDAAACETIGSERMHFRHVQRRNERNARKAFLRRNGETSATAQLTRPSYATSHTGPSHAPPHAHARRKELKRKLDSKDDWQAGEAGQRDELNDLLEQKGPAQQTEPALSLDHANDEPIEAELLADDEFAASLPPRPD